MSLPARCDRQAVWKSVLLAAFSLPGLVASQIVNALVDPPCTSLKCGLFYDHKSDAAERYCSQNPCTLQDDRSHCCNSVWEYWPIWTWVLLFLGLILCLVGVPVWLYLHFHSKDTVEESE
mmetsp:Transcript_32957/g.71856  ORF Transcript_32957/g.71856 Transcript_32957/m.71856 type:complete len:120 (+) Transcript_32957:63-422(+)